MNHQNNIFQSIANNIIADSPQKESLRQSGVSLYDDFSKLIFATYRDLSINPKKKVVSFNKGNREIFSIHVQTSSVLIVINAKKGSLKDVKNIMRDVSKIGHWGNGDYQLKLDSDEYFKYVIDLIRQIY